MAEYKGSRWGDGEPNPSRPLSATETYWLACEKARELGASYAWIYESGGFRRALVALNSLLPYYGDLKRRPAPIYVLSVEEILAAAEPR